ncbi:MAG TPA: hypothetical protein VGE40_00405 [Bacilli bacterium]
MKGSKNLIYLGVVLAMLVYAIPLLEIGQGFTPKNIFAFVWIGLAMLVIAAHLHQILGVDEETRKQLARVKRYKSWQLAEMINGKPKRKLRM